MDNTSRNFWAKVNKPNDDGCWLWAGCVRPNGYGWVNFHGTPMNAHRASYMMANDGEIPKGMDVCHSCDVRNCVNPAHLWLGTRQQNVTDMHNKNRARKARGESASNSVMTEAQVVDIRQRCAAGETHSKVAKSLGVSIGCVSHIVERRNWKHVK